jgi:RNA polymerase primary sigma factor
LNLYGWQHRALTAWQRAGFRGVIEAVTGTGKTRVAMAAVAMQLAAKGRVAVLVHTRELVDQWEGEINTIVPPLIGRQPSIGHLGSGVRQTLAQVEVLIATAQSAAGWQMGMNELSGLLIADEVHHYGADAWLRGLESMFDRRLGLTATYEREDYGVERFLDPYFGGVCYSVGYEEALHDRVIAPFKIAFVGVAFSAVEAVEYQELSEKLRRQKSRLVALADIPEEPFGEFIKAVGKLSHGAGPASRFAGLYLGTFNKRRGLLSSAGAKLDRLRALLPSIKAAERTIIFSQTQAAAKTAVERLADPGISGAVLHAGMDVDERRDVFAGFEDGTHDLVAAPRLLDEGVDVPAADLAIVLAASRSRRQMIQRMGRVIRPKADGRLARLAIFYVEGTSEDPEQRAHEDFVDVIESSAADVAAFSSHSSAASINAYLTKMYR